jgi:hypothetical protein
MHGSLRLNAQDKAGFPEGFDAVEAAPQSHRVLYENAFVRVLQVQVAPGPKSQCIIIDGRVSFSYGTPAA